MRKLMWFTLGFALACTVAAYGSLAAWLPAVAAAVAVLAVVAVILLKQRRIMPVVIGVLAGCAVGIAWFGMFYQVYLRPVAVLDGQEVTLTVTAAAHSRITDYGATVDAVADIGGKPYRLLVYLSEQKELQPGDSLAGTFRIRLTTPGGLRESTIFQGRGTFLVLDQRSDVSVTSGQQIPKWCYPAVLSGKMKTILESALPADAVPFAKALLLGDTGDLDYETDTALKISGIRHIVAVSGLHISILYGLVCVLTLRHRFLTALVGLPMLVLFGAVTGFSPSVIRAAIMVGLMLLALLFDREYDPPTALSFAVLVMLSLNPLAAVSASLQLSVGCVAGILLFNRSINTWMKEKLPWKRGVAGRLAGIISGSVSVTLSAMSLTTPLCAWYFGLVSLIGVVTNLITLWVVQLVFIGLALVCLLWLVKPAFAAVLGTMLAWPIRYVLTAAKTLSGLPFAAVYTDGCYVVFWLVFVYVLLGIFLVMRKKQPGQLILCAVLGLCLSLGASWAETLTGDTTITMLDVGQGQSILLQTEGKTFLVDCGGDDEEMTADILANHLLSRGISRVDGIVLTHYDRDHAGALPSLLTRIDADLLFLPDTNNAFPVPETGADTVYVWEDLELSFGAGKMTIFGPVYSGYSNENSLCVLFDTEKCDILITGDRSAFGERMLLRGRVLPDVDILVAGHHGAADSASEELLQAVTPETVLISVSENNIYGHPAPALLQRLQMHGCAVYRTDENGTITIRR